MRDAQLIALSDQQLSLLSTLKLGSVAAFKARELTPAVSGSNVYTVRALKAFCYRHIADSSVRLSRAIASNQNMTSDECADRLNTAIREHLTAIHEESQKS